MYFLIRKGCSPLLVRRVNCLLAYSSRSVSVGKFFVEVVLLSSKVLSK